MRKPSPQGKRSERIHSYVTEGEFNEVIASSKRAGVTVSEFIRRVCLGLRIESREDHQARRELLKVNADLGRLGGLLKQALAEGHGKDKVYPLLREIDQLQIDLKTKIKAI